MTGWEFVEVLEQRVKELEAQVKALEGENEVLRRVIERRTVDELSKHKSFRDIV